MIGWATTFSPGYSHTKRWQKPPDVFGENSEPLEAWEVG